MTGTNIRITPTISTGAYTAGDNVGGKMSLTPVAMEPRTGTIMSVTVADLAKQSAAIDILLFDSDPSATTFTDNAALDVADADLLKAIGVIRVAANDYVGLADNSVACVKDINLPFKLSGTDTLYATMVTSGTPTYAAATDLTLTFGIQMDTLKDGN